MIHDVSLKKDRKRTENATKLSGALGSLVTTSYSNLVIDDGTLDKGREKKNLKREQKDMQIILHEPTL